MLVIEKDIVVGSRVKDLVYALENDKFLILNGDPPEIYESLYESPLIELWSFLYWQLFFKNDILGTKPKIIRLLPELRKIKIIPTSGAVFDIEHTKDIFLSSVDNVESDSIEVIEKFLHFEVADLFEVNSGSKHDMWELLSPEDKLVKKIIFFISDRIDGNKDRKDLVSYSYLSQDQLSEFEYSDTMVRFKVESTLQQNAIQKSKVKLKHVIRKVDKKIEFKICSGTYDFVKKITLDDISRIKHERYKQFYFREKKQ